jgi:hypothetical protein
MEAQQVDESTTIDKGIRTEISWMRFGSDKVDEQAVFLGRSLCRFIEGFDCFQNSTFECIGVILSTQCICPALCPLWSSFAPLFNLVSHWNTSSNFIYKQEVMIKNIKSIYFVSMNDGTDCHPFFFKRF